MKLNHLAISVSDQERSRRSYIETLGVTGSVRDDPDGLLLTTNDGFGLALLHGMPPSDRDRFHFGFGMDSADHVRSLRARLLSDGVEEVEWWELDDYVSTRFLDPDGYIVEVFWEKN